MSKKFFVSLAIVLCAIFSFTVCFAADDAGKVLGNAANGVRNFVGGVENTVENAAKDVSNTSKNITGATENTMNTITNNGGYTTNGRTTDNNNDGKYTTSRVATDTTVMGMTQTAWTWLIIGIAAIAIIAVVWYYSMQFTNNDHKNNDRLD